VERDENESGWMQDERSIRPLNGGTERQNEAGLDHAGSQTADRIRHHRDRAFNIGATYGFIGVMTDAAFAAHEQHRHGTD